MGMRATGHGGELRYGYHAAVTFGRWVIEASQQRGAFDFRAPVVGSDEVWIECRPLDLVLALGPFEWIWRDVKPTIVAGKLSIELTRRPDVAQPRFEDTR